MLGRTGYLAMLFCASLLSAYGPQVAASCAAPANPIEAENCQVGNPSSEWDISGAGDSSLQGFATDISVNRGATVSFKIDSNTTGPYRLDIYRMGYYGGMGARKVATVPDSVTLTQNQPNCLTNATTGLIDCGNWTVSATWAVPANATSGIYFARAVRTSTGGASHIVFIVRDDASTSDVLFQTSDTTWQAYNNYGGNSLYTGSPAGRAYKVSYNRPLNTRAVDNGQDWVFNAEYPMVRWLEANGYNVSYFTGVDSDRRGNLISNHKAFLSVGHDEYWSGGQRANVESARNNAGVHLAFFSGNEVFWKTRWENSIDGSGTTYRTLVSYKETHANAVIDPQDPPTWTGTWRDPRFSPPADGGRPENELTGTIFTVNASSASDAIKVPEADGKMRLWRNTTVATLAPGAVATLAASTLGYEWDEDLDNGFRPPGLVRLSSTTINGVQLLQDYGSTYAAGTATHRLTLYKHGSGALVFGAGTVQWSWGLDSNHDRGSNPADARMRQATVNLFADMGVQPATLQAGLVTATVSTDTIAPSSTISSPTSGSNVPVGNPTTISGTATDAGGGVVGGVEVSVDGGVSWQPANGRATWSYSWIPSGSGNVTIKSRAADDSGNLQTPGPGVTVTVGSGTPNPCTGNTIWPATAVPANPADPDTALVELGMKFRSDVNGFICGIRFYKGSANTGTHVGKLWSSGGTLLAQANFTGETASGWQQVNFPSPVAITANTVYVASYHAPNGRYAADTGFFATAGVDNPPLHALQDGVSGGNGVYQYGTGGFPASTFQSTNYWVDVVFTTSAGGPDTSPPTNPTNLGATAVGTSQINLTWTGSTDNVGVSGYRVERCQSAGCTGFAEVATATGTSHPDTGLTPGTTYQYRVRAADAVPNFSGYSNTATATTATSDTTAPTVSSTTPANGATGVAVGATVTAIFSEAMDPATVNTSTFELRDASGALVTAPVSYNPSNNTATLTPSSALANGVSYTATVKGGATDPRVKDLAGNALAASVSWSFTTASSGACTGNTIWPATAVPAVAADPDTAAVELGVKFRSDVNGTACGVRFYKGSTNTGTHVGKLWSGGGTLLAQATFAGETASGWQQVNFSSPVAITANTVYVASYHAPNGRYAVNEGYFTTTGVDSPPLHALQNGVSGGNGVYLYGAGGFPTNTFGSSNYWVDLVFIPGIAPTLASIAVTPANPTIQTSATQQFTATGTYSDSSTQNITTQVTWASSTPAVATINSAGLATAGTSTGSTAISATSGTVSGNTTLTVQTAPPITNTGLLAPSANAAVTSSAGDNNGFETTPSNAYVFTDGLFAVDTNSGTNANTSCTNAGKDKHSYYNYNFIVPSGVTIRGIEVRLAARVDSAATSPSMCAQLSWNGGTSWTTALSTPTLSTATTTYILGGATNTWGRTWTVGDFSNANFRVRIIDVASSTARDFSLDGLAVQVTYQ